MKYVLLLRGINVGGKNKVKMEELRELLAGEGCCNVLSYINSGNFVFDAPEGIGDAIGRMLAEHYSFPILFALIPGPDYEKALSSLPVWWQDGSMARRDALFFTDGVTRAQAEEAIGKMKLRSEAVHYTDIAVFWGKLSEAEYSKTAYHKHLAAEPLYKKVTIRNGNTVDRLLGLLKK